MERHAYLRRLAPEHCVGRAFVHWSMTVEERRKGWLSPAFHAGFRETLLHALLKEKCACAVYTLMPDHIHMLIVGYEQTSDQRRLCAFARKHINKRLAELSTGYRLQKQAYDHVLREDERLPETFAAIAWYIAENPVRAGLVESACEYPYTGALVPGYPEISFWAEDCWERFWRIWRSTQGVSHS